MFSCCVSVYQQDNSRNIAPICTKFGWVVGRQRRLIVLTPTGCSRPEILIIKNKMHIFPIVLPNIKRAIHLGGTPATIGNPIGAHKCEKCNTVLFLHSGALLETCLYLAQDRTGYIEGGHYSDTYWKPACIRHEPCP